MFYYAGIGARKTPMKILEYMQNLGKYFAERGLVLRSGGAIGADTAFEAGCDLVNGKKEIYLPWKDFNSNKSSLYNLSKDKDALEITKQHHPAWNVMSHGALKLQTRNVYQVLGSDLCTPSAFVVCYTDGSGGTMQAIRIARANNIPVVNLKLEKPLVDYTILGEHLIATYAVEK